jgi:hypothetical protein
MVTVLANSYAKSDANYLALAERKITWGEFNTATVAARNELTASLQAVGQAIDTKLQNAHAAEVQQRQAAAAALGNWAYQQQVLLQNQQAINAANRPRTTSCQYVGAYLNCTTF